MAQKYSDVILKKLHLGIYVNSEKSALLIEQDMADLAFILKHIKVSEENKEKIKQLTQKVEKYQSVVYYTLEGKPIPSEEQGCINNYKEVGKSELISELKPLIECHDNTVKEENKSTKISLLKKMFVDFELRNEDFLVVTYNPNYSLIPENSDISEEEYERFAKPIILKFFYYQEALLKEINAFALSKGVEIKFPENKRLGNISVVLKSEVNTSSIEEAVKKYNKVNDLQKCLLNKEERLEKRINNFNYILNQNHTESISDILTKPRKKEREFLKKLAISLADIFTLGKFSQWAFSKTKGGQLVEDLRNYVNKFGFKVTKTSNASSYEPNKNQQTEPQKKEKREPTDSYKASAGQVFYKQESAVPGTEKGGPNQDNLKGNDPLRPPEPGAA